MKTYEKIVLAVVITLIAVGVGYSVFKKEEMVKIPLSENTTIPTDSFKEGFMGGCMEDGTYSECNCYYNSLQNQMGTDGLVDMSVKYLKTEEIPAEVLNKVIKDCVK